MLPAAHARSSTATEAIEAERLQRDILELEQEQARREALAMADAQRRELAERLPNPKLAQEYQAAKERADAIEQAVRSAGERSATLTARAQAAAAEAKKRQEEDAQLQARIAELEERTARLRAASTRTLRLPKRHRSEKRWNYWILVAGGCIYPCNPIADNARHREEGHESVSMTAVENGLQFIALPGRGQPIEPGFERTGYMAEVLRRLPTADFSLHFAVYPDSYAAFLRVRDFVVERGYSYNWAPQEEGVPLTVHFAKSVEDQ
ncbi:MAG: hypothetical protein HYZ53_28455 [Planctomycetes bacterium]|nr:hypothetical protein [Planctomycetota bacterium]